MALGVRMGIAIMYFLKSLPCAGFASLDRVSHERQPFFKCHINGAIVVCYLKHALINLGEYFYGNGQLI